MSAGITLVVALPAEAAPIADHFGLDMRGRQGPYRLYGNERMRLVVSGPGSAAAAGAVRWLLDDHPAPGPCAWLNVGIAGHAEHDVGLGLLASRVIDAGSGREYELEPLDGTGCATGPVCTVAEPVDDYPAAGACDMEAAGFVAALQAMPPALVQCYKIVSDNPARPARQVTARLVRELVGDHLRAIAGMANALTEAAADLAERERPSA